MASNPDEERDVLIVGAGAAGGAMAWSLARRKLDVVCLEQGDWVDRALLPKNHVDWEVRTRRYWSPTPNIRQWPADYPVASYGSDPVSVFLYNAVGGSTIGYAANFWRFAPSDFRVRSLDGVGVDWPIAYEDLAPFYTINEREMGVAGLAGDPWLPPRDPLPLPPAPLGVHGRKLIAGYEKLGWEWWPTEHAVATRPYDGRPACDFKSFCPFGCPQGALGTVDVTYWRKALRSLRDGVDLRTNARVREITLHPDGRARGALYYDADGRLREVRAKVVVLACGGVGTPRLLLQSRSSQHPDGLANSSGLVGKNLMVHIQTFAIGRFAQPVRGWEGTWGGTVSTRQFYETDPANDYVRGFVMSGCPGWSPLNLALQIAPWGEDHHATIDRALDHEITLFLCGEDLPNLDNRVELDWDNLDAFGLPGARTFYTMDGNSKRLGAAMLDKGRQLLAAAGAESVRDFGFSPLLGWHLMGTARMGSDPADSVVDADNRAHDVPNLFIADSSSLPTGGGVNPTSTIQAVALRCAERIWARRDEWA
jgi:choline dehydrogenase-like flavoprotein